MFVERYARDFCRDTTLECRVAGAELVPDTPVAPETQNHVLAVVKEALNNVLKHAHATRVVLSFSVGESSVELRIADDGIGFDPSAPEHAERNGLHNMRTRVADTGGQLEVKSTVGQGTTIVIREPLAARTSTLQSAS